jgi:hypothetical protein
MHRWRGGAAAIVVAAIVGIHLTSSVRTAQAGGTPAPEIQAQQWLNSKPLSLASLRGRVVAVEFWTYG